MRKQHSMSIALLIFALLLGSSFIMQSASALSNDENAMAQPIMADLLREGLPESLSPQQVEQLMQGRGNGNDLSLQDSIVDRYGTPDPWSTDDIVGLFGDTNAEYQKVWEPWITRAATHSVTLSEDKQFLAVGTGYLSDNEIHVYRWNPEKKEYLLVSQVGDGIIGGDVVDIGFADIDNNGFIDLAAASTDGYVYLFEQAHIYDPSGSSENRFDLVWQSERMLKASSVFVYDADLDGFTDVIAGGWDGKIRVYEYRERSPYPFSREHTKYLKEVFVSEYLGSPVQQVRGGDFDGDYLPEILVGLRDGTLLIFENAGETIDTPNGPFPITYDNFYRLTWNNTGTIWRPILDIQVDDIDNDKRTEAAIIALGQDVFLLDSDNNELVLDKVTRSPQSWEQSGVYPIDYYMDVLMNASNIYFNGNLSASEPMDWKDGGNKVSPYTSGMVNRSDSYYSLLRASAGKVWALMDWGSYEELVPGGNSEADIVIHLNSPWNGAPSNINLSLSMNFEKWSYLDSDNIWLSPDKTKIFIDVDPIASQLKWKFIRYVNMTLEGSVDMEIVYWEAARINLRLGDARSVMFSNIIDQTGTSKKVLTVASTDGKLLSFSYLSAADRKPYQSRMKMILDSYADQLFSIDTGGAWQMVPDPLVRPIPNWRNPDSPPFTSLQSLYGYSAVQQVTIGPSLHPYFYLLGDTSPNDLFFVVDQNNVTFLPDPQGPSTALTSLPSYSDQIFKELNSYYDGYSQIRIAVMDILYMPWEDIYPMPEILVSYYRNPNTTGLVGDAIGNAESGIDLFVLSNWNNDPTLIKYQLSDFGFYDPNGNPIIDKSGALQVMAKGLREPLELGTGDFDGDGIIDLVVSDGKRVELFKQTRNDRKINGTLTLVPNFFEEINSYLPTTKRSIENLQGFDYDNDNDADLLVSFRNKFGFTFFENIGNDYDPIWKQKRSFVHNRNPNSSFTNYNFELAVIWADPDSFSTDQPSYQLFAVNDTTEVAIYQPSYIGQQAWVLATYPEVKVLLSNFYNDPENPNWGFEYYEAWSNTLLTQNWTRALDVGILDGDNSKEVVIADYDNNLYVFEHLTNNTYKRAYRSPDLQRIEQTSITPYASDVLVGLDAPINRTVYENARYIVADVDLDGDALQEIIVATDTQIYRIEATGYNDEFEVVGQITLPSYDPLARINSEYAGINLDIGITALDAVNDMNMNEFGEIIVGYGMYLLVFELTDTGDFKEIMGYDVRTNYLGLTSNYLPSPVTSGNPYDMPFGTIQAVLVEDINRDGFPEIILGGKMNLEIGGYPGFLRILSSGENQLGYPNIAWTEVWNETMISGFMERNYVTSLTLDDQNYDGNLDLIVGHKYGFDILDVTDIFSLKRLKAVTGSPGYPIESYTPVLGFPRNNGSQFDMYSSSITQDDAGTYFIAYSQRFTSALDPLNYDNRKHIFFASSVNPNDTTQWTTPTMYGVDAAGVNYYAYDEIMPSLTFSAGVFAMTWVTYTYSGASINASYLWFTWTTDFSDWTQNPPILLRYTSATTSYSPYYITTPQIVAGPPSPVDNPTFVIATAINNFPIIFAYAIEVDPLINSANLIGPNKGFSYFAPQIPGTNPLRYLIQGIGMTVAEKSNSGWFDLVVSMKYFGNETTSYDLWHARMIHPAYYNESQTLAIANWTRITNNYVDETYPTITRTGSERQGLIISYMTKGNGIQDYEFKTVTGISANNTWPYQWSEPSTIPNLPYEFHQMRIYQSEKSKSVFDGRLFNEAFKDQFYVSKAKYNLFEAPNLRIGRPALAPYKNGYALAYPLAFRDPFSPVITVTVNVGDTTFKFVVYNVFTDMYVLANPEDSFLYTDLSETVDLAVGDTDRDGRREVLVGYGRTAELFELQKWTKAGQIQYTSEWTDASLQNNWSRLETTAVAIFDANGNGFEEMFIASRGGDVRAFEITDTTLGVSYGSAFRSEDITSVGTSTNWYDLMATSWGDGSNLVSLLGVSSSDPSQTVLRVYYNANTTNLGSYAEIIESNTMQPIYVINLITNTTLKKAIIVAVFSDGVNSEVRTYEIQGSALSFVSNMNSLPEPLMTTITGGARPFEPLFADVTGDGSKELIIATIGRGVVVNSTGGIRSVITNLGLEIPQGFDTGDVNGDGIEEIITTYGNNTVVARNGNGTIIQKWELPKTIVYASWYGVATLDVNNDGNDDYILGRNNDGLVVAINSNDGSQFWNMTLGTSEYVYFRALQTDSNKELYIINGYGNFVAASITPEGMIRWLYRPTNAYKYAHNAIFDAESGEFLILLSNASFSSNGGEHVLVLDQDGAVKAISYLMMSPGSDVDQITSFQGLTGLGIKKGQQKVTRFTTALPVTWLPSNPYAPRLEELTLRTSSDYELLIADTNFDGINEYFFYSLEQDKLIATVFDESEFTVLYTLNLSEFDLYVAPVVYLDSSSQAGYLVLANQSSVMFFNTEGYVKNIVSFSDDYSLGLNVSSLIVSDFFEDSITELYVEMASARLDFSGASFIAKKLYVFGEGTFEPLQEFFFTLSHDIIAYSSNKDFFGFIWQYYIPSYTTPIPTYYFSTMALVYEWTPTVGLTSFVNYTTTSFQTYFMNLEFQPFFDTGTGDELYLIDEKGIVWFDGSISDASPELANLYTLPRQIVYNPEKGNYQNRTYTYSDFREFKSYFYTGGFSFKNFLFIGIRDGPFYVIQTAAKTAVKSPFYYDNYALILSPDRTNEAMFIGVGDALLIRSVDGTPTAASLGYKAQGFITGGGYWGSSINDIWYKTLHGDIIFAGDLIRADTLYIEDLAFENLIGYNGSTGQIDALAVPLNKDNTITPQTTTLTSQLGTGSFAFSDSLIELAQVPGTTSETQQQSSKSMSILSIFGMLPVVALSNKKKLKLRLKRPKKRIL